MHICVAIYWNDSTIFKIKAGKSRLWSNQGETRGGGYVYVYHSACARSLNTNVAYMIKQAAVGYDLEYNTVLPFCKKG